MCSTCRRLFPTTKPSTIGRRIQRAMLLADASGLEGQGTSPDEEEVRGGQVTVGIAAILGTGGGSQVAAVMRFLGATTVVRVGDTVEWTNRAPSVAHTVTFGTEPANRSRV
jgi:hypothetical protein